MPRDKRPSRYLSPTKRLPLANLPIWRATGDSKRDPRKACKTHNIKALHDMPADATYHMQLGPVPGVGVLVAASGSDLPVWLTNEAVPMVEAQTGDEWYVFALSLAHQVRCERVINLPYGGQIHMIACGRLACLRPDDIQPGKFTLPRHDVARKIYRHLMQLDSDRRVAA